MTANAGYHAYATGDVLTAAQVQYNLQNQTVMYFATSAARTTALGAVTVEGMVSYIPANGLEYYNGSAWTAVGATNTPSQSNPVLNSAFQVWQRGTSVAIPASTGNTYSADRWTCQTGSAAITISRQATGDTTNLPFIQYCARYQRNSGQTGTNTIPFVQNFESINTIPFAGKTITFSFYARAGANYSPTSNALAYNLAYGTGTDQNVLTAYTGETNVVSGTATLTTTWQRFTATAAMSASATEMYIRFNYSPTGTAGTNDYYEVTGVQVEVGSVATPFDTYATTIQGELAACQRYYYQNSATNNQYTRFGNGITISTSVAHAAVKMPVTMRTAPSLVTTATASNYVIYTGSNFVLTSVPAIDQTTPDLVVLSCTTSATQTINAANYLAANASTAALLGFNAEL